MKIGIDLDDVVVGWVPSFMGFYNNKIGNNLRFEDLETYYFEEIIKKNKKVVRKLIDEFFSSEFYDKIELIDGAKQGIEKLSDYHQPILVTARLLRYQDRTEELLSKFDLNIPLVNCRKNNDVFINKGEVCNSLGIELFIEDCRPYALDCAKKGIKVFLFDRSWNQRDSLPKNIIRVYDWNQILKDVDKNEYTRIF